MNKTINKETINNYINELKIIYRYNQTILGKIDRIENYIKTLEERNNKLFDSFKIVTNCYENSIERYDDLKLKFKTCKLMHDYYKKEYLKLKNILLSDLEEGGTYTNNETEIVVRMLDVVDITECYIVKKDGEE